MRGLAAAAFVLLAGAYVVRGLIEDPDFLASEIMAEVGRAAAQGQVPGDETLAKVEQLAQEEPLSWEPFLVQGAMALRSGDHARAERLILSARQRAPRAPAARYLLADLYLRTERPLQAMTEMAVLNRLLPAASMQLAPSLAEYARTPGSVPQLRAILASYPELETPLLAKLSWDPRNADLILALASIKRSEGAPPDWQRLLLTTLVNNGQYEKAYAIWRKLAGVPDLRGGFYNPTFADNFAPAPFNWQRAQGAGGVAEPSSGGLQIIYFGRDNVELANQILLLPSGRYRLELKVSGDIDQNAGISWKAICLGSQREILKLPLPSQGRIAREFAVPADCKAQRVTLLAEAPEFPRRSDFHLRDLQLTRIRS